jgi:hypothetical protein
MKWSIPSVGLLSLCVLRRPHEALSFAGKNFGSSPQKKKTADKKKQGYLNRSSGIKTKRKKPPKWEKEGVSQQINISSNPAH